ncbi:hypothetical protein JXA40_07530 [bacterium]|nr:hypothetical protein [candidate division CSSED10-310 bacterium]
MTGVMKIISFVLNNMFTFSMLLIVVSSIIGLFIRMRARDRCLRNFDGFRVTLEKTDGRIIWGILKVYGSGIELEYQQKHRDLDGHFENTYILYNSEFDRIRAIYRYHDQLTEANKKRRLAEIRRSYNPNPWQAFKRKTNNFFNTFRDGINQTFHLIVGNLTLNRPHSAFSQKQKDITGLGGEVLGSLSKAYDPILEKYIGHFVVIESYKDDSREEKCGILKEYTDRFIEILNVSINQSLRILLDEQSQIVSEKSVRIVREDSVISVVNDSQTPLYLKEITGEGFTRRRDVYIGCGKSIRMNLDEPECLTPNLTFEFTVPCVVDIVFPRSSFAIRHGGLISAEQFDSILSEKTNRIDFSQPI